jgi:Tol biopolymer transport system component
VFVANVLSPKECSRSTDQFGAAYLISSGASTKLRGWGNVCETDGVDTPDWAPDGRGIVWRFPTYDGTDEAHVYLSDAHGRHLRKLLSRACQFDLLYSPNGKEIAYENTCTPDKQGVYVLDLTSGIRHFVADGELEGWSPDGSELALLQGYYCAEAGSIVIVPAAGGTARSVITWPATC